MSDARVKWIAAAISLIVFAYVAARAAQVPLTYDEAASYIRYVDTSSAASPEATIASVFNFEVATNHLLNTVLTKLAWTMGGSREIWLRLPNLIGYAVFAAFAIRILAPRCDPVIALAGVALIELNPYLIEFFALSRGYGLAVALMTGSVCFVLRFLETRLVGDASRALACAAAAVVANFALLDLFAAVVVAILAGGAALRAGAGRLRTGISPALPIAAALFGVLVLSQDVALSADLYAPVSVTLTGVQASALDRVRVIETDLHGRERRWTHDAGVPRWQSNPGAHVRGIRVELPQDDAALLAGIETVIGGRLFASGPALTGWVSGAAGTTRILSSGTSVARTRSRLAVFRPAINWMGDRRYAGFLARAIAVMLGGLAVLAVALKLAGRLLVRTGHVGGELWQAIESAALWTAVFAGLPLYLLKRHAELYFGGIVGLVPDTFLSLIDQSFYGRTYATGQTQVVVLGIILTVLVCAAAVVTHWRRGTMTPALPAVATFGLISLAALLEAVQHAAIGTPYLINRTALFFIPLFVLFLTLAVQTIAVLPGGKPIGRAVMAGVALLAAAHFFRVANLTQVREWQADASTKAMFADLGAVTANRPRDVDVHVGVQPLFAPVAVYYARRTPAPTVGIVAPSPTADFYYGAASGVPAGLTVLRTYALTDTVLAGR